MIKVEATNFDITIIAHNKLYKNMKYNLRKSCDTPLKGSLYQYQVIILPSYGRRVGHVFSKDIYQILSTGLKAYIIVKSHSNTRVTVYIEPGIVTNIDELDTDARELLNIT